MSLELRLTNGVSNTYKTIVDVWSMKFKILHADHIHEVINPAGTPISTSINGCCVHEWVLTVTSLDTVNMLLFWDGHILPGVVKGVDAESESELPQSRLRSHGCDGDDFSIDSTRCSG